MKLFDLTLASPAENLAGDEALLNRGEAQGDEILRFWEPREYFVVVGYANRVETEVNLAACQARDIPVFRRCSGGGTVLQGPGCLNYTLILQIGAHPSLANISAANRFIMDRNCGAVQSALGGRPPAISVRGHTDLALGDRKFSGNSQRRNRRALLFHGTFLLNLDLSLINEVLRMPSRQPDYRNGRGHSDFLTNLVVTPARLKAALKKTWQATEESLDFPVRETGRLAAERYSTPGWNLKS
ncbi:MAG TPA: lipoate--protein ligase family protein [Verrucomicrobiae bacterium]|nr:lipoate--protein ligase family protein [Verrucomicrobiae bacterium]